MKHARVLTILTGAAIIACKDSARFQPPPPPNPPPAAASGSQAKNTIVALLDDMRATHTALLEAFTRPTWRDDVAKHSAEITDLTRRLREAAAQLESADFETIRRDVSELQHTVQEIEDAAKEGRHEESHHAAENMKRHLDTLAGDVEKMAR